MSAWQKIVVAVLLMLGAWAAYGAAQRAVGRREAQIAALTHALDSAARVGRGLDTVYQRDTVRLRVAVDRWRALRDTLLLSDTVLLTRRETVLVARADSVIRFCLATVATCEQRVANLTDQLTLTERQRDLLLRQASPSLIRQITDKLPWIAGAYLIGRISP